MMKQVLGFCGTSEKMKLWKYRESDMYSLCDKTEDNIHVLRCNSEQANQKWSASIDALEDHLVDNNTPSNTVNMIVNQLHSWRDNTHTVPVNNSISLTVAILSQEYIGWQAFVEGCLLIEWRIHVSTFLTKKQSLDESDHCNK